MPFKLKNNSLFLLSLALLTLGLMLTQQQTFNTLVYQRAAIISGEYWRLISGQLVHTNSTHSLLNVAGLLIANHLIGSSKHDKTLFYFFLISSIFISAALFYGSSTLDWYAGLSGIIHGLLIICCLLSNWMNTHLKISFIILINLKAITEQYWPLSSHSAALIDAPVITLAHLYGVIVGNVFVFARALFKK